MQKKTSILKGTEGIQRSKASLTPFFASLIPPFIQKQFGNNSETKEGSKGNLRFPLKIELLNAYKQESIIYSTNL